MNRYLQDRASRRRDYSRGETRSKRYEYSPQDYRRGGSRMDNRMVDREYDSKYDYEYYGTDRHLYPGHYAEYPRHEMYAYGEVRPVYDHRGYDYSSEDLEKEYKEDLHKWIEKLSHKDRFRVPKEQIIKQAKNMGVTFSEFSEEEFYAIYLAMVTDHKNISNDYNSYIKLAQDFFDDDDVAVSPSEKVCIYMYEIVLGGKHEK